MTHYIVLVVALVCALRGTTTRADHGRIPDEIYEEADPPSPSLHYTKEAIVHTHIRLGDTNKMRHYATKDTGSRRKREAQDERCKPFEYNSVTRLITHPRENGNANYSKNITCITLIEVEANQVIHLTFIDQFHIEEHETCEYDYIEIRDGQYGFAKAFDRFCGRLFPPKITSTGPYLWLKFKSDENIEYEGFKIQVDIDPSSANLIAPTVCVISVTGQKFGNINSSSEEAKNCWTARSTSNSLDILWNITTPVDSRIYLNFTSYHLEKPNECEVNLVQVFGAKPDMDNTLAYYCGSASIPVYTKEKDGNRMFIRFFTTRAYKDSSKFTAKFVSYRTLKGDEGCDDSEFDCEDSTCIDKSLVCDHHIDCRLKTDEDKDSCPKESESLFKETHILVILVIFSLILSGMSFVFLFKCIRKLYQDHKIIKEHIKQSTEDILDQLNETQLQLDPKLLDRRSQPRASLERENHTNEMYKQQRNMRKPSSIDSDFIPETHLDVEDEWRREAESMPIEDIRIEHKGRSRRSDTSRKEESLRSARAREEESLRSARAREEESLRSARSREEDRKEIRDASVGAPDTKESGCQTRESLFQGDTALSSDGTGSGTNSRGFSTFGYSGATIARPSPAPNANTSQITIELLRQATPQESVKSQKKMDRRPMSSETTRSAPDVIIVSKPVR